MTTDEERRLPFCNNPQMGGVSALLPVAKPTREKRKVVPTSTVRGGGWHDPPVSGWLETGQRQFGLAIGQSSKETCVERVKGKEGFVREALAKWRQLVVAARGG